MTRGRSPELDGLRGIAIVLVLAYHAGRLPGGWIGVILFFALSGHLITTNLTRENTTTGTIRLPAFYRRRIARLLPGLILVLTVWGMVVRPFGAFIALAYLANVALAFGVPGVPGWMWSLSIEEQFYLLWPSILRRTSRRFTPRQIACGLVGVAVLIAVSRVFVSGRIGYNLVRGDEILLGCAVAMIGWKPGRLISLIGAILFTVCLFAALNPTSVIVIIPIAAVGAAVTVAGASHCPVLRWWPLRHLGHISYALYLWDVMIGLLQLRLVPSLLLLLLVAEVSTWLVERPAQRWLNQERTTRAVAHWALEVNPSP